MKSSHRTSRVCLAAAALCICAGVGCYRPHYNAIRNALVIDCRVLPIVPECVRAQTPSEFCCEKDWGDGCEQPASADICWTGKGGDQVEKRALVRWIDEHFQSEVEEECVIGVTEQCDVSEPDWDRIFREIGDCYTRERGKFEQEGDDECRRICDDNLERCGEDECDTWSIDGCFDDWEQCVVTCDDSFLGL